MPKIKKKLKKNTFNGKCHFYEKRDVIKTPENLYRFLDGFFGFNHDPCPLSPKFDGLNTDWGTMNFVNPPYSQIKKWVAKGVEERNKGRNSLFLITVRTNTKYWFEDIFPKASKVWFIKSGICFEEYEKPLPIPLCLVLFCSNDFDKILPSTAITKWVLDKTDEKETIKDNTLELYGLDLINT